MIRDVHTEHCCIRHGCKYAEEDCTVLKGARQSFPCEDCASDPMFKSIYDQSDMSVSAEDGISDVNMHAARIARETMDKYSAYNPREIAALVFSAFDCEAAKRVITTRRKLARDR